MSILQTWIVLDNVGVRCVGCRTDDCAADILAIILHLAEHFDISSWFEILAYIFHISLPIVAVVIAQPKTALIGIDVHMTTDVGFGLVSRKTTSGCQHSGRDNREDFSVLHSIERPGLNGSSANTVVAADDSALRQFAIRDGQRRLPRGNRPEGLSR